MFTETIRWTTNDLELLPDDSRRYEILEYWIADRQQQKLEVYRRDRALLKLAMTLYADDQLTSPTLPEFRANVGQFF